MLGSPEISSTSTNYQLHHCYSHFPVKASPLAFLVPIIPSKDNVTIWTIDSFSGGSESEESSITTADANVSCRPFLVPGGYAPRICCSRNARGTTSHLAMTRLTASLIKVVTWYKRSVDCFFSSLRVFPQYPSSTRFDCIRVSKSPNLKAYTLTQPISSSSDFPLLLFCVLKTESLLFLRALILVKALLAV